MNVNPIDLTRAKLAHVMQHVSENIPSNYKLTFVARCVGGPDEATIVLTEDHPMKAADVLSKFHAAAFAAALGAQGKPGDKTYLAELAEDARRRLPDGYAFAILVCPFGSGDRKFRHTASCDRESMIAWLKEYAALLEAHPELFGGHL